MQASPVLPHWSVSACLYFILRVLLLTVVVCELPLAALIFRSCDLPVSILLILIPAGFLLFSDAVFSIFLAIILLFMVLFLTVPLVPLASLLLFLQALFFLRIIYKAFREDDSDPDAPETENSDAEDSDTGSQV